MVRSHLRQRLAVVGIAVVALALGVLAYRGIVSVDASLEARARANAHAVITLERRLGIAVESQLQRSWLGRGVSGAGLTAAYALLYWPFVLGTAVVTLRRYRPSFRLFRNTMAITGAVGLVVILAFPVAPPRLLPGFEDHVAQASVLGSLAHPSGVFNPYAAMPSFHVGWVLVAALALRRATGRVWPLAAPLVMAVAVVTTGNHYLLDVLAGAALAGAGWVLATPMQRAFDEAAAARRRYTPPPSRPGRELDSAGRGDEPGPVRSDAGAAPWP